MFHGMNLVTGLHVVSSDDYGSIQCKQKTKLIPTVILSQLDCQIGFSLCSVHLEYRNVSCHQKERTEQRALECHIYSLLTVNFLMRMKSQICSIQIDLNFSL